ncbi:AAA family ATPase [Candidatus Uhrbacteria bacterium]|nr:AAA family ATPase [Candidatus Uhrbacteria bacterium]
MYLKRLEVQGFKTFAAKTSLEFPEEKGGRHALTVVVGPNGSGKSNLADAIRWCLGEQSLKLLRGKKAEDVIFSGSEGKSRSGFAEVSLTFDNRDQSMGVEFSEVVITRRLYRDGESAYLVNGAASRLADIQLMLAEAGVGQRSYSVIGQGMIDHVLPATPEERKIFFDDAMGVRGFQMKRHQALLKLTKSAENLSEVELLLGELEPRLNSLKRQVDRLQKRATVEAELRALEREYYGSAWWALMDEKQGIDRRLAEARGRVSKKQEDIRAGDEKLAALERSEERGSRNESGLAPLQAAYKAAQQELAEARRIHFTAERELELAKVKAQSTWAPLPLHEIILEVGGISDAQKDAVARLKAAKDLEEVTRIADEIDGIFSRSKKLKDRLTKPNPEDFTPSAEQLAAIDAAKTRIGAAEAKVKESEAAMDAFAKQATAQKSEAFAFQRELRALQQELFSLEQAANGIAIEMTRVETRLEGMEREMADEIGAEMATEVKKARPETRLEDVQAAHDKMIRLKHQLEVIGGIDEEVMKEYETTNERFTFLSTQVKDLRDAIRSTEKIIDELDLQIRTQSEKSFAEINKEFQRYFKVLFNGGTCSLVKMTQEEVAQETKVNLDRAMEEVAQEKNEAEEESVETIQARVKEREDAVAGIDIQATPPGKKLKALNLLSGGERALTSIALVSAIMATNPSPFVVLDEVDAALDEANTVRFANILNELQKLTQFIVITHNRATMEKADMLYGVTMGTDGISKLLSVSMEDIGEGGTARR